MANMMPTLRRWKFLPYENAWPTVEHISGFVRMTADTFVFLGGDISHLPGMYRPTAYKPMPATLPIETYLDFRLPSPCPCSLFTACHPSQGNVGGHAAGLNLLSTERAFVLVPFHDYGFTVESLQEVDAGDNAFVAIAHGNALRHFVNEPPVDCNTGRGVLVDGLLKGVKPYQ